MSEQLKHFEYVEMNDGHAFENEPEDDEEVYVTILAKWDKDGRFWPWGSERGPADPFWINQCKVLGWFRKDDMGP